MIRIKILSPGKIKEEWLQSALLEYVKRLKSAADFDFIWTKDSKQLAEKMKEEKHLICLDPNGKTYSSETFATFFFHTVVNQGSSIAFAIGGAEGFPEGALDGRPLLSLSPMTFTHQMARLLLTEQIFRAFEIERGSSYHK